MRRALIALPVLLFACGGGGDDDTTATPDSGVVPDSGILVPGDTDGDEWPEDADNCPGLFNPEQRDRDGDGIGDDCDTCPATPNSGVGSPGQDGCEPQDEQEPNDVPGGGEAVSLLELGKIREVRGVIEAPGATQAFDRFEIMVPARTLIQVRVARAKPESLLEPLVMVSGGGFTTPRIADGLFVAEREIYVAEAGTYEIAVADRRGVLQGDPRGSDTYAYALALEVIEASPQSVNVPFQDRPFVLIPAGKVGLYQADLPASDFIRIATQTDLGLGADDGLDTVLIVERADGTVMENDDLAPGFLDSRVILALDAPETLRIVIDHARIYGTSDYEVRLTIDTPPNNVELEPNDTVGLASALVYPGETAGRINKPLDPNTGPPDIDWYRFDGTAGQIIALTGLIPASSQVDPVFVLAKLIDESTGEVRELYRNFDSGGLAPRLEAILDETGPYVLLVADQGNLGDPPYRGSDDDVLMRYGIFAEPVGLQPEPVVLTDSGTISASLTTGGRLVRHLVIASGPTVVIAERLDVSDPDVDPYLRIYGPNATGILGEGAPDAIAYLDTAESYVLAVHNANDGKGSVGYTYDLFVRYLPVPTAAAAESEPNDDRTTADPMNAGLPTVIRGRVDDGNADFFRVTLQAGTIVSFDLSEGRAGKNVSLYDPSGAFLAGAAGGIAAYTVPAAGTYAIEVAGSGPYTLIVR